MTLSRIAPLDTETEAAAADLVDCAGIVRSKLGVGHREEVYKECLERELRKRGRILVREREFPILYDGELVGKLKPDGVLDGLVVLEAKATTDLHPVFYARTLTYLRHTGLKLGFLVNFYSMPLSDGIHRLVV